MVCSSTDISRLAETTVNKWMKLIKSKAAATSATSEEPATAKGELTLHHDHRPTFIAFIILMCVGFSQGSSV